MTKLIDRWQAFDDRPFPGEAAGDVNGVNLKSIERHVAFLALQCQAATVPEVIWKDINLVFQCRSQLARAMPALSAEVHGYFAELDAILAQMLDEAASDAYRFSNITGVEVSRFFSERVAQRLPSLTNQDQLQAMLGAALVAVANVLRGPVEAAPDKERVAEQMIQLTANWLRQLLEPAFRAGKGT